MTIYIPWKWSTVGLAIGSAGFLVACTAPATQQAMNSPEPPASAVATSPSSEPAKSEPAKPATTAVTKTQVTPTKSKDAAKTAATDLRRVSFAAGKTSTKLDGRLGKYGAVKYVLGASKGQTLRAGVVSEGCSKVTLDVFYLDKGDGLIRLDLVMNEERTNLKTTLTSSGDYVIQVQNADLPSCQYSLSVDIK